VEARLRSDGQSRFADPEGLRFYLLVLRCQAGDEQAFAQLFEQFSARTLRYLRGLLGGEAEDVQQEVWLTVYRSIRSLTNPGAFRTWLFRTTRHRAIDHLRKQKRESRLTESAAADVSASSMADDSSFAELDEAAVEVAMAGLSPTQREVLLLRFRDELSYAEIALVIGCPIGTVRGRLHYAKQRLREILERGKT
jgi:RNA polymerase sigma-70 factor (ECF subfamily)